MGNLAAAEFPKDIQSALESLYRAIADPAAWTDALHQLAQATNSVGCFFYPRDQARALLRLPVSPELREFIDAYVEGGWFLSDPRALRGWSVVEQGHMLITDDHFMLPGEHERSRYFQDFQRLWKIPEWAAVAFRQDGNLWCLSLLRSERQGPIVDNQKPVLTGLSSHLGRIIELATILHRRESAREIEMLERAGVAAVLLDWKGTAVGITSAAEALFQHDFSIQKGQFFYS